MNAIDMIARCRQHSLGGPSPYTSSAVTPSDTGITDHGTFEMPDAVTATVDS